MKQFLESADLLQTIASEAEKVRDYNKTRLRSPVTPIMRYSLADAFVMTVVHGQRHLAQA
jgi:hypothetical protein